MELLDWPEDQHMYISRGNITQPVRLRRYKGKVIQDCDEYIGHKVSFPSGWNLPESKWANPFPLKGFNGNRSLCCETYRKYILSKPELMTSLHELQGKR